MRGRGAPGVKVHPRSKRGEVGRGRQVPVRWWPMVVLKHFSGVRGSVVVEMLSETPPKLPAVLVVKGLHDVSPWRAIGGYIWWAHVIITRRRERLLVAVRAGFATRSKTSVWWLTDCWFT